MEESVFTKIIRGEIPCHKVFEDEKTIAFLDIHPAVTGHTLVVPKAQVDPVWDLDDDNYVALMQTVKMVANHLKAVLGVPYVGVKVEGLDVPHAHLHLIPFSSAAEFRRVGDMTVEPDHAALAELASRLAM